MERRVRQSGRSLCNRDKFFVYGSGAQYVLTNGEASSVPGRALAAGVGLMLAVYCGLNASGSCVNPCIALMFCLTDQLRWKKWPLFVVCEFTGAFLAAALTFGVYYERIDQFDGGVRAVFGDNATAHIFTSFPAPGVSKMAGFFDVAVGCGLLTGCTLMIIDPNNAKTPAGIAPISLVFMLYGIIMSFGINTGAPVNLTIDFAGRVFTYCAGYGTEVFTRDNYWFWVPPVACVSGTLFFVSTYMLMIGNHLPREKDEEALSNAQSKTDSTIDVALVDVKRHAAESQPEEQNKTEPHQDSFDDYLVPRRSGQNNEGFRI